MYSKYVQVVPLYRQEKDYAACGAKLSRQTMSNWVIWAVVNKAKSVFDLMKEKLISQLLSTQMKLWYINWKEKLKPVQECRCTA